MENKLQLPTPISILRGIVRRVGCMGRMRLMRLMVSDHCPVSADGLARVIQEDTRGALNGTDIRLLSFNRFYEGKQGKQKH